MEHQYTAAENVERRALEVEIQADEDDAKKLGLPQICQALIDHGRAADTPAALVQQGTTQNQRVFTGTLANLPQLVAEHEVHAPTLVIVGEVVTLREKLAWFDKG